MAHVVVNVIEHNITIRDDAMKIEIFGSGCPKCIELEKRAKEAVLRAKLNATFYHIYDIDKIVERGIFVTPALVVDSEILFEGKLPSVDELVIALTKR
jgi:small redox-active disulfide protein 2